MDFEKIFLKNRDDKQNALCEGVEHLFNIAKKSKEENDVVQKWDVYESLYNMTFMKDADAKLPKWQSKILNNQAFKIVETVKPFVISASNCIP